MSDREPLKVARIAGPAPPPPAPPAAPWTVCRTCGRPSILVRRMYDSTRIGSLFASKPIVADKALNVAVLLQTSCGQHLLPVVPADASTWGFQVQQLIDESARQLPFDHLSVRRRLRMDGGGRPIVGLAGPFAASIATDERWMEHALRAAGAPLLGLVRVESFGENVITFRSKEQVLLGPMGKELRKVTKAWGLPEPLLASFWGKDFARQRPAAGGLVIEGEI